MSKILKISIFILVAIFLIGCGGEDPRAEDKDPRADRAEDKAMMVEKELELGHITKEEAECMINLFSDFFSDDEKWATLVGLYNLPYREQIMLGLKEDLSADEQKMLMISFESTAVIPEADSECNIDVFELTMKRTEDIPDDYWFDLYD
tara:strand:- start:216 stop:662 length:447 start_codon:yes stop_codon:yes gene_type:complete